MPCSNTESIPPAIGWVRLKSSVDNKELYPASEPVPSLAVSWTGVPFDRVSLLP